MGQLSASGAIFLSAGVPDPLAKHFVGEGDSAAIVSAVSALLYVSLGRRKLVWGGHPAITPMIWSVAGAMNVDYSQWVQLYQSRYFDDDFPEETARFGNVVFTERVAGNHDASLDIMRREMIAKTTFGSAVFIGGMAGLFIEYNMIRDADDRTTLIPLATTGGAAKILYERDHFDPIFARELDYVDLLHRVLEIDPNERRYVMPAEQPIDQADRISRPGQ